MEKPWPSDLTRIIYIMRVKAENGAGLRLTSQPGSIHRASAHLYAGKRVRLLGLKIYRWLLGTGSVAGLTSNVLYV